MFKITIQTEMTTGHKFTDTIYAELYDNTFIEDILMGKAERRGFNQNEVDNYTVTIENDI